MKGTAAKKHLNAMKALKTKTSPRATGTATKLRDQVRELQQCILVIQDQFLAIANKQNKSNKSVASMFEKINRSRLSAQKDMKERLTNLETKL